jgi:hypothetical protein
MVFSPSRATEESAISKEEGPEGVIIIKDWPSLSDLKLLFARTVPYMETTQLGKTSTLSALLKFYRNIKDEGHF